MESIGYSIGETALYSQRLKATEFKECVIEEIDLTRPIPFTVRDVKSGDQLALLAENLV